MKKLMIIGVATLSLAAFAGSTDVYDFKMSAKVPYLNNGVRTYASQTFKGYMYVNWDDNGLLDEVTAEVQNSKTKVIHKMSFTEGFYNLMGKGNKYIVRNVPTVAFTGADVEEVATKSEAHELIKQVALAGTGSLEHIKGKGGCSYCGEESTEDCDHVKSLNGNFVGYIDCECPEDVDWNHTLETTRCGLRYDESSIVVRTHDAAFWGTWSMKYNKKLSTAE